jgi:CxxC-x17-CxxC domain-containing protein
MAQAETRTCRTCSSDFRIEPDDFGFYERMGVPAPALCPMCRFQRRSVWRNERTLYKRDCSLCKRSIISMYNPKSPYIVYCYECWHSDKWDPFSFARDYDSKRPFLDQFRELMLAVPKVGVYLSVKDGPNVNSEYTNCAGANKNCYLIFNSGPHDEDCAYSRGLRSCRNVLDMYFGDSSEKAYEGVNVEKSSGVAFVQNAVDCLDSWFLLDCVGSAKCFGCVNLRHGSYKFFNEQLDKEEWQARVQPILGSYAAVQDTIKKFEKHALDFPRRENANFKCVDCTGNYLYECKNCKDCYEVNEGENLRYCFSIKKTKDCYDLLGYARKSELMLECVAVGLSQKVICSWLSETSQNIEYCSAMRDAENCFGCDGLSNASYCILNKRYEPEEYRALREKIIAELAAAGEYGLFFPPQLAPFAYNETIGQENSPMTENEALAKGFRWEHDIPVTRGKETMKSEDIPDHIKDIQDSILDEILACVDCGRNYRLIRMELEAYRKAIVPIPRRCFDCRYQDRIRRRGSFTLYDRKCAKCAKDIRTPFAPERPETVYCEQCYQAEVV